MPSVSTSRANRVPLLPYRLVSVPQLNIDTLSTVAKRHHLTPAFAITPLGIFDSALVAYLGSRRRTPDCSSPGDPAMPGGPETCPAGTLVRAERTSLDGRGGAQSPS